MFSMRNVILNVSSRFVKFHYKNVRKCHSNVNQLHDYVKSFPVQKYFSDVEFKGVNEDYKSEEKFFIEQLIAQRKDILGNLTALEELEKSSKNEDDFVKMVKEERGELSSQLLDVEVKLFDALAPSLPDGDEIMLEISAGVGGQEAMLFAGELREMYLGFIEYKRWDMSYQECYTSDLGGVRHSTMFIEGRSALKQLRYEAGIHRVQRIPATEKAGRVHTSTVSVAVLPRPRDIDVKLNDKDLVIETKRSSGAGGQHVNKTESAVRITHLPTGISVECQTDRSQIKNREVARQKLVARLYEKQQNELTNTLSKERKAQVGTSARSDKIRTYNFPQDRITDHRIGKSLHNLPGFLLGGQPLESLITDLIAFSERERYDSFVSYLSDIYESVAR